jgi:hypothetical protein
MKILLQQNTTGLYLRSPDVWVRRPAEASDFPSSSHAIAFKETHGLHEVRLVFKFEEEGYVIRIPLEATAAAAAT